VEPQRRARLRLGRRGRNHGGSDLCLGPAVPVVLPGERKEFPVVFFVDPAMAGDEDARDIAAITLSYTFYNKGRAALEEYLRNHPLAAHANEGSK